MTVQRFWRALGGRKNANAYLCALLLTVAVFFVAPEAYRYYGAYLLAALGITNVAIAWEDVRRSRNDAD